MAYQSAVCLWKYLICLSVIDLGVEINSLVFCAVWNEALKAEWSKEVDGYWLAGVS